ncbi:hypothetical protein R1flu_003048 [Riccia fluitans]|uniref:SAM domain-containing protein n=1 Tax=Riccia fluitans TaxID=41844 RepID=A0ABD1Y7V6_9MARC
MPEKFSEFDSSGSVDSTVEWVSDYLGYTGYSEDFRSKSVDGSALLELAKSMESLALLGLAVGHRAKLVQCFREYDDNPVGRERELNQQRVTKPTQTFAEMMLQMLDPDYISYDDIFKRKHNGKLMVKDKHPAAWKALHAAHHIVWGWFKDWETDQRQHDILHLNFTKYPRMKDELNEFIRPKMAELPALVLAVGRKKMKKRLSEGESSGSETILASQSLVGNKYPGGQYSQLLGDEPELMNQILDGERLGLHLMKNKPTIDTLVAREKTEISQSTSEVVKLAGMGTPVAYGQKEPYITFKPLWKQGMELEIARSYTRIMTDEEVFDALRSARWEFKSKDLRDGGQSLAEELSRNKEKKSVKPEDPKIHISESSLFKEEEKEKTVGEEYKRRNKKDEGIGTAEQTVGRSDADEVDLESEEDVTNKLSDSALEIVTMVIVGCDTKDELALAVCKFIAHVNKQDGCRRPFTGHKGFTVLEKCHMIVDYALASEKVSLIGQGRMKHHKIVLDRTNVHSIKSNDNQIQCFDVQLLF